MLNNLLNLLTTEIYGNTTPQVAIVAKLLKLSIAKMKFKNFEYFLYFQRKFSNYKNAKYKKNKKLFLPFKVFKSSLRPTLRLMLIFSGVDYCSSILIWNTVYFLDSFHFETRSRLIRLHFKKQGNLPFPSCIIQKQMYYFNSIHFLPSQYIK